MGAYAAADIQQRRVMWHASTHVYMAKLSLFTAVCTVYS